MKRSNWFDIFAHSSLGEILFAAALWIGILIWATR